MKATGLLSYDEELSNPRKGIVVDFLLRLTAPPGSEIKFSDIITFIKMLKEKGFNIHKVTYDGYQSLGEIQRLNEHGIDSELLSVDKTTSPYDTLKDLLYMGLLKGYPHSIIERELFDLIKDEKGKIDHPDVSWLRLEQEGIDYGSKDVADPLAGSSQIAIKEIGLTSGICF